MRIWALIVSAQCRRLTLTPVSVDIQWQSADIWAEQSPEKVFEGDSILLAVTGRVLGISNFTLSIEGVREQVAVKRRALDSRLGEILRRYCSAKRLPTLNDDEATALAVQEGLLCKHTAMFAVDIEVNPTNGMPQLVEVPEMIAVGSHGYGIACASQKSICRPEVARVSQPRRKPYAKSLVFNSDYVGIPTFVRRKIHVADKKESVKIIEVDIDYLDMPAFLRRKVNDGVKTWQSEINLEIAGRQGNIFDEKHPSSDLGNQLDIGFQHMLMAEGIGRRVFFFDLNSIV